jgi:hypothetical protein
MAFNQRQYENLIRTIVVGAVAKEFRKAKIIKKATDRAVKDGKIATGALSRPDVTGSMIPTRDDRWLLNKDSIIVRVGSVENGLPSAISVDVKVDFGVDEDYAFTRKDINAKYPNKFPNLDNIKVWIKSKSQRGLIRFDYNGKPADLNNDKVVSRIAYAVGRKIKKEGISKRYRSNYFKPVENEVDKVLSIAMFNASQRILDKYEQELYSSILEAVDINIV